MRENWIDWSKHPLCLSWEECERWVEERGRGICVPENQSRWHLQRSEQVGRRCFFSWELLYFAELWSQLGLQLLALSDVSEPHVLGFQLLSAAIVDDICLCPRILLTLVRACLLLLLPLKVEHRTLLTLCVGSIHSCRLFGVLTCQVSSVVQYTRESFC